MKQTFYFTILLFSTLYSHAADLVCAKENSLQKNNNLELKFDTQMKISSTGSQDKNLLDSINVEGKCSATISKSLFGDVRAGVKMGLTPRVLCGQGDDSHIFVKSDGFLLQLGRQKSLIADKLENGTQFTEKKSETDDLNRASLYLMPTEGLNLGFSCMLANTETEKKNNESKEVDRRLSFSQTYQFSSVLVSLVQQYSLDSKETQSIYGFGLKYNLNDTMAAAASLTINNPYNPPKKQKEPTKTLALGGQFKQCDISLGASGEILLGSASGNDGKHDYSLRVRGEYKICENVSLYGNIAKKHKDSTDSVAFELGSKINI